MKKKIEALLKRLQIAVRHNPAEVVLSVLFCCFGCALYETCLLYTSPSPRD